MGRTGDLMQEAIKAGLSPEDRHEQFEELRQEHLAHMADAHPELHTAMLEHSMKHEVIHDHGSNPLVQAAETDDEATGIWTVGPASHEDVPPVVEGLIEHLGNCEVSRVIGEDGIGALESALHASLTTAFYMGVYAERNRILG